ncbi:Phosphoinositide 3-kinase [Gracilaria domingensis]|nr:Phosphoinositide 3-kinase [Gracilaria domingensis]
MWGFRSPATSGEAHPSHSASRQPLEIRVRDLDAERPLVAPVSTPLSMGGLLRLFRSEFFDAFMAVTYLYRYRESRGVHDYLCNELYKLDDADLETFMPQICNLLVHHARDSPGLERFIMDRCADSMHVALQVFWFLQAAVEDASQNPNKQVESRCRLLRTRCETAAVNGSKHVMLRAAATRISAALVANESPFSRKTHVNGASLFPSSSAGQLGVGDSPEKSTMTALIEGRVNLQPDSNITASDFELEADSESSSQPDTSAVPTTTNEQTEKLSAQVQQVSITQQPTENKPPLHRRHDSAHLETIDENQPLTNDNIAPTSDAMSATVSDLPHDLEELKPNQSNSKLIPQNTAEANMDYDPVTLLTMKQERFDYFNDSISIAKAFVSLSLSTRELQQDQRQAHLTAGLDKINDILLRRMKGEPGIPLMNDATVPNACEVAELGVEAALRSVHLPLTRASSKALRILRIHSEEVVILTSRTRAPYLVNIEVLPTEMLCSDKLLFCEQRVAAMKEASERNDGKPLEPESPNNGLTKKESIKVGRKVSPSKSGGQRPGSKSAGPTSVRRLSEMTPRERQLANVRNAIYGDAYTRQPELFARAEESLKEPLHPENPEQKARQAVILGVYGELWTWKEERILSKSPFKNWSGTKLMPFIVKAGDDLRQEQLAIQLISQFKKIFDEEGVHVFLRPFTVMSVSSEAGFVEVLTDSVSVHSLKKRTPNFVSLLDYFERAYGKIGSRSFRAAQRRFIRSMAGYSLVTYFLQIKDRHNGNIMIDALGRVIHIDFGFMLTNSPGAIKFENVPFKLTEEYLQVICAQKNVQDLAEASKTEGYRYFQELFVLGMLAVRKHQDKITTLVEIMTEGTTMPCMTGGHSIVESLRSRFAVGVPEEQCIKFGLDLIEESRLSWRSAGYDRFQAYSNGYR